MNIKWKRIETIPQLKEFCELSTENIGVTKNKDIFIYDFKSQSHRKITIEDACKITGIDIEIMREIVQSGGDYLPKEDTAEDAIDELVDEKLKEEAKEPIVEEAKEKMEEPVPESIENESKKLPKKLVKRVAKFEVNLLALAKEFGELKQELEEYL